MTDRSESEASARIRRVRPEGAQSIDDRVAVEEPMEIRVAYGPEDARSARSLSVTMRTPGNDFELAAGFLFTEGILQQRTQIRQIEFCGPKAPGRPTSNIVKVDLTPDVELDLERLQRNFYTTSSCGICGKASLDALHVQGIQATDPDRPRIEASVIHGLPERLRADQPVFARTGGLHAAALVDTRGSLLALREDVGRHNAVDKLLGRRFLDGEVPLGDHLMLVSGRASFEILQKALVAGVPMIVAVGAPSSLAVQMAERFGMTLVGFAGPTSFNIYSAPHRIITA
jgi:FdhD protein